MLDFLNQLLSDEAFIGGVVSIVGTIVSLAAAWAAATFKKKTGIEIDEKHLRAFHEAIKTGVESAMRHDVNASVSTVRAHVVQHLKESVPEALTRLTPGDGVIDRLIERYSVQMLNKLAAEPK